MKKKQKSVSTEKLDIFSLYSYFVSLSTIELNFYQAVLFNRYNFGVQFFDVTKQKTWVQVRPHLHPSIHISVETKPKSGNPGTHLAHGRSIKSKKIS